MKIIITADEEYIYLYRMYVHKVGCQDDPQAKAVRIVHISDTHMRHDRYLSSIPQGDILIHSGDFSAFSVGRYLGSKERDRDRVIEELNNFFQKLPFKHKIFVPGNHELSFKPQHGDEITRRLEHATYLQDQVMTVEGIKIYGTPWTSKRWYSFARGFAKNWGHLEHRWNAIPDDTDILVTHMPPLGIKDLATKKLKMLKSLFDTGICNYCGGEHGDLEHWGCEHLRYTVLKRVRPKLHLYGHVHEDTGVEMVDGITFSNAAMKLNQTINIFDFFVANKPS